MQLEKGYPQHDTRAATHCIDLPPSQGTCHIHFHAATCAVGTLACTHTHMQSHKGNQVALPDATGKSGALPRVCCTVLRCFMRLVLQHVRRDTTPICSCQHTLTKGIVLTRPTKSNGLVTARQMDNRLCGRRQATCCLSFMSNS